MENKQESKYSSEPLSADTQVNEALKRIEKAETDNEITKAIREYHELKKIHSTR